MAFRPIREGEEGPSVAGNYQPILLYTPVVTINLHKLPHRITQDMNTGPRPKHTVGG